MNDELISLFIDDELNLDDKMVFVETVHSDSVFTEETLGLLKQEKLLTTPISINRPMPPKFSFKRLWSFRLPFNALAAVLATAMIIMFIVWPETKCQNVTRMAKSERYFEPVEIASMLIRGATLPVIFSDRYRYWKYPVEFSPGENGYSYFLDWKMSTANSNTQFRKNLKLRTSEFANISLN